MEEERKKERKKERDDVMYQLYTIVTDACNHIYKTFDIEIPNNISKLWEMSYNEMYKNHKIFALYSCGSVSKYLFHCLKENGYDDTEIVFVHGTEEEKKGQATRNINKERTHFFLKVHHNNTSYIIDNVTHMEIDIFEGEQPRTPQLKEATFYSFKRLEPNDYIFSLVPHFLKYQQETHPNMNKTFLETLKQTITDQTKEKYGQWNITCNGENPNNHES